MDTSLLRLRLTFYYCIKPRNADVCIDAHLSLRLFPVNLSSVFQSSISQCGDITRQVLRPTTGATLAVIHEMHPHIKPTDDFSPLTIHKLLQNDSRPDSIFGKCRVFLVPAAGRVTCRIVQQSRVTALRSRVQCRSWSFPVCLPYLFYRFLSLENKKTKKP